jgi:hypothetical protein
MTAVTAARIIKVFHGDHHEDDIHVDKLAGGSAFDVFSVRSSSLLKGASHDGCDKESGVKHFCICCLHNEAVVVF